MRYLGGKTRNAKAITEILNKYRKEGQVYLEPFCGGLSLTVKMEKGPMILNDYHKGLITLFKSIQDGLFEYPKKALTVEDYNWYKNSSDETDPMFTAVGFGLSYAGKWWGGYDTYYDSRGKEGQTTKMLVNSLKKKFKVEGIKSAEFLNKSYDEFKPKGMLIYCDPPYADTTGYKDTGAFDHDHFWEVMREWSKDNDVFISEFNAPEDFEAIWEKPYKVQMCKNQNKVVEKLFKLKEK